MKKQFLSFIYIVLLTLIMVACGSGGGSDTDTTCVVGSSALDSCTLQ